MRRVISDILNAAPGIAVVGTARDGEEALQKVAALRPDVVTLDVEMPVRDGLSTLEEIMKSHPVPVVMLSSMTQAGAEVTVKALQKGAVDFVAKPSGPVSLDLEAVKEELVAKVRVAARARSPRPLPECLPPPRPQARPPGEPPGKLVLIGTSTGGPRALAEVMTRLPGDLPAAVLVVQHMPAGFTRSLAERLDQLSALRVKEAEDGEEAVSGTVYIAPGDSHLLVERGARGPRLRLSKEAPRGGHRPSVDVMMVSAARAGNWGLVGVLLTGMGNDGLEGFREIKARRGKTIAEDASTAVVYGMPRAVVEAGLADVVVPLPAVAGEIVRMLRE